MTIREFLDAASVAADQRGNVEGVPGYADLAKLIDAALAKAEGLEADEEPAAPPSPPSLNDRELGAVLAGLRALQNVQQHEALAPEVADVMTCGGTLAPLDDDEIDALCERLNR